MLLAHGRAVQVIRARAKLAPQVGTANVAMVTSPADESSTADIDAARSYMFSVKEHGLWSHAFWGDPMVKGEYPAGDVRAFWREYA